MRHSFHSIYSIYNGYFIVKNNCHGESVEPLQQTGLAPVILRQAQDDSFTAIRILFLHPVDNIYPLSTDRQDAKIVVNKAILHRVA